jgi:N-methylhydantoinase B
MGVARDLHGEGFVIPPVKLQRRGEPAADVIALLRANVRAPDERMIDLQAQESSLRLGEQRILALCAEHGRRVVERYAGHLMDYSAKIARRVVREIPDGIYRAHDVMEDDGVEGGPFELRLALHVRRDRLRFDYRGTAGQALGGINANRSIVIAASLYALRCLCPERLPTNEGLFRVLSIETEPGSLLDPTPPAPVAGGNVETSQRLVDVCMQALALALPERIPAASAGTMSNLTIGGVARSGAAFAMYETLPGGAGASANCAGATAVQTHMTNTRNTPIEEFEQRCPVLVRSLTVRRGSGGRGARRGGDGIIKDVEALAPLSVSLFAERHVDGPAGLAGGGAGRRGVAWVIRGDGRRRRVAAKTSLRLEVGDRIRVETPGGGGFGER